MVSQPKRVFGTPNRSYRLWSGKKIGMPGLFGGKAVPIRTTPYVEAGLKVLKRMKKMGFGK